MLKKKYSENGKTCEVTFGIETDAVHGAEKVNLVGDFNNWNLDATPMKKKKDGSFEATVKLEAGREYYFRYLIDLKRWENDWNADKYVPSPYGDSDNSVVIV